MLFNELLVNVLLMSRLKWLDVLLRFFGGFFKLIVLIVWNVEKICKDNNIYSYVIFVYLFIMKIF